MIELSEAIIIALITSGISVLGIVIAAVIAYLVGRRQNKANAIQTETKTNIDKGAADAEIAKQAVEVRLLGIEANQKEIIYYQSLVDDMKERDKERAVEQAALLAQVAEIKQVQTEAQNSHNDRIEELLKNIDGLIVSLGAADEKIVVLQNEIAELRLEVEGSNQIITALQEQVVGLQEEVRQGNIIITTLREEIKTLLVQKVETEKEGLETTNAALTKALE